MRFQGSAMLCLRLFEFAAPVDGDEDAAPSKGISSSDPSPPSALSFSISPFLVTMPLHLLTAVSSMSCVGLCRSLADPNSSRIL
jgi:hypothetical protein